MKTMSPTLASLINSRSFMSVDLYTYALQGGGPTLYYTSADFDVHNAGTTWISSGPRIDVNGRPRARFRTGLDVDTWETTIAPRLVDPVTRAPFPDTITGAPWLSAVAAGALDGAIVTVQRGYFATPPAQPLTVSNTTPVGLILVFFGMVATVELEAYKAKITLEDMRALLRVNMPRNVYQATCRHILYDSRCTLNKASYSQNCVVAGPVSTAWVIATTAPALPGGSNTYNLGKLVFASGALSGLTRSIAIARGSGFDLMTPLPAAPAIGDGFTVSAGCDKSVASCQAFGNYENFGGFPWIPLPENVLP
jgi:uncharacterized phage protein (TIGR02218 family)